MVTQRILIHKQIKKLYKEIFTKRIFIYGNFHTQFFLHKYFFYTEKKLHTDFFSHKTFYAEKPLYKGIFIYKDIFSQKLLHTNPITQRNLYSDNFNTQAYLQTFF